VLLFERIAAIMELDEGLTRLERFSWPG